MLRTRLWMGAVLIALTAGVLTIEGRLDFPRLVASPEAEIPR